MKMLILVNRDLNEKELFTVDRFSYYFDYNKTFTLVGDNTIVLMDNDKTNTQILDYTLKSLETVNNTQPDFSSYIMDDGNAIIEMNQATVYSIINSKAHGISDDVKKVPAEAALNGRQCCLDDSYNVQVIAIVKPE